MTAVTYSPNSPAKLYFIGSPACKSNFAHKGLVSGNLAIFYTRCKVHFANSSTKCKTWFTFSIKIATPFAIASSCVNGIKMLTIVCSHANTKHFNKFFWINNINRYIFKGSLKRCIHVTGYNEIFTMWIMLSKGFNILSAVNY